MSFIFIFAGGGLGAILRHSIGLLSKSLTPKAWLGTFIANMIGCTILFALSKYKIGGERLDPLIKVGFLGALTTFSTYCLNVVDLARQNNIKEAVLVLCLNVFFGIIIGVWMFRDDIFQ